MQLLPPCCSVLNHLLPNETLDRTCCKFDVFVQEILQEEVHEGQVQGKARDGSLGQSEQVPGCYVEVIGFIIALCRARVGW